MGILAGMLGTRYGFDGGLFLTDHKADTARNPIQTIEPSGPLHIPIQVSSMMVAMPIVTPGERVCAGQPLSWPATPESVAVHAPTSGSIVRFENVRSTFGEQLPGLILEPDGKDERVGARLNWEDESFMVQIALAGAVCTSPRGSAHGLIQNAIRAGVTDLIINAMESEPFLTADLRTLVEEPGRMVDAACEIADAMGVGRALFALPERHRRVLRRLQSEAVGRHIEIIPLPDKYPQCNPIVLTKTLLGREVQPGGSPNDVLAAVLPLAAVRGIAGAILDDRPVTHAVVTLAGDAVEDPGTYRVPVGMPVARLAECAGVRGTVGLAVCGGPLTGTSITHDDAVVTADTVAILLFAASEEPREVSCVHCGWCVEDCPIGLDPYTLSGLSHHTSHSANEIDRLRACVDCGLCSYVCPSRIPLAATIRQRRLTLDHAEAEVQA